MNVAACASGEASDSTSQDNIGDPQAANPYSGDGGNADSRSLPETTSNTPDAGGGGAPDTGATCTDEATGCRCPTVGQQVACWTGPANQRGVGACHDGTMTCAGSGGAAVWGSCDGQVTNCGSGDAGPVDAGPVCLPGGGQLTGAKVPAGTTASATKTYTGMDASNAIDGNANSMWNAGDFNGSLTLYFPSAQAMMGLNVLTAAPASPPTDLKFTAVAFSGGVQKASSTLEANVSNSYVFAFQLTPGSYDEIRIDASSPQSQSWVGIFEVSIKSPACP